MSVPVGSVRIPVPRVTFYAPPLTFAWNDIPCAQCLAPVRAVVFTARGSDARPCGCRYEAVGR